MHLKSGCWDLLQIVLKTKSQIKWAPAEKESQVAVVKEINITVAYSKEFIRVFNLRKDSWVTTFPFA